MSGTHLHLMLTHIPILGIVFGLGLFLFALMKKSIELKKICLGIFVLSAIAAIPVYFTGESAEERVEDLAGVSESIIERHEESAQLALAIVEGLGLVALGGLLRFRYATSIPTVYTVAVICLALSASGVIGWTANLGGQIRHTEIRTEAGTVAADAETEHDGRENNHEHEEEGEEED